MRVQAPPPVPIKTSGYTATTAWISGAMGGRSLSFAPILPQLHPGKERVRGRTAYRQKYHRRPNRYPSAAELPSLAVRMVRHAQRSSTMLLREQNCSSYAYGVCWSLSVEGTADSQSVTYENSRRNTKRSDRFPGLQCSDQLASTFEDCSTSCSFSSSGA